jgi:Tol biopolymer transport system component
MPTPMLRLHFLARWLLFVLVLSGCSIEVNQSPPTVTAVAVNETPKLPVTWEDLNLTGKLIYIAGNSTTSRVGIHSLDLHTGDLVTIFQVPQGAWVEEAAVSPDRQTLILSYSPPMEAPYGGQTSLHHMPLDGSEPPQLLITPQTDNELYSQPTWSPDGKYVYFVHIYYQSTVIYKIMRMTYPDGKPETLMDQAYWPRISEDGSLLVYVSRKPESGENELFFANADGTDRQPVPLNDLPVPFIIDAPMFSPDNQSIIFSSPLGLKAYAPSWMDRLLGVQVALANGSLPSDWWSVPITGGRPSQLTNLQASSLFGTFSPDKKHLASFSLNGIFVMNPDGTELTMVVNDVGGIPGTVDWIP